MPLREQTKTLICNVIIACLCLSLATASATTVAISVSQAGESVPGSAPTISASGERVAFVSRDSRIVDGDTNAEIDSDGAGPHGYDVFVRNREDCTTVRASVDSSGGQANDNSVLPALSADGRFVTFISWATNLVPNDLNGQEDVFVHDTVDGSTARVNVDSKGNQAMGKATINSGVAAVAPISANGEVIAFSSRAYNLTPELDALDCSTEARCSASQALVRLMPTGQTILLSKDAGGTPGDDDSIATAVSSDGQVVAFVSAAALVPSDTTVGYGVGEDLYLENLSSGELALASRTQAGEPLRPDSVTALSDDGCVAVFQYLGDDFESDGVAVFDCQLGYASPLLPPAFGTSLSLSADGRIVTRSTLVQSPLPHPALATFDRDSSMLMTYDVGASSIGGVAASADGGSIVADIDGRVLLVGSLPTTPNVCESVVGCEEQQPADAAVCELRLATQAVACANSMPQRIRSALEGLDAQFRKLASAQPRRRSHFLSRAIRRLHRVTRVVKRLTAHAELDKACSTLVQTALSKGREALNP